MYGAWIPILALLHTIGALIGTVSTTFAEVFFIKASADDEIDKHERRYLRRMYRGISAGMIVVLFSASALMTLEYLVPGAPQAVLTAPFWMLQALTLIILVLGAYLTKRSERPLRIASAGIFTAWWFMLLIDLGFMNALNFVVISCLYLMAVTVVAIILEYVRVFYTHVRKAKA